MMIRSLLSSLVKKNSIVSGSKCIEGNDELPYSSGLSVDKVNAQIDNSQIRNLICLYHDGRRIEYPVRFNIDEYINAAQKVYERVGINKNLKEIKLVCGLPDAGLTKTEIISGIPSIIVSVSAFKVGITTGLITNVFSMEQCNEFCDVLAHELFHAQSSSNIILKYGVSEFETIKNVTDVYVKWAHMMTDEYYACRKNGEVFGSIKSVESLEEVDKILSNKLRDKVYDLLYSLATIIAFTEISIEYRDNLQIERFKFSGVFHKFKELLARAYIDAPLNFEGYKAFGNELKSVIEPLF